MTTLASAPRLAFDARIAALLDPNAASVFSGVVHGSQIWTPDPFDVEGIHSEAREVFRSLVNRASSAPPPNTGKTLLLLGEAGSGKTHLLRAFRNSIHAEGKGYVAYFQMTTRTDNYARYILAKLIDGLEQPYLPGKRSGLARLALGLLEAVDAIPVLDRDRFLNDFELQPKDYAEMVERFTDLAIQTDRFQHHDIDLIRGLLWLLPNDGRIHPRALKWLRCEDLSDYDRGFLGGTVPRHQEEAPLRTIEGLGKLIAAIDHGALVLLVDQLEETLEGGTEGTVDQGDDFRRVINKLVDITDAVPTAIAVIACLEDHFSKNKDRLSKPKLDRLLQDPAPIRLVSHRSADEIKQLLALRLETVYSAAKVDEFSDDAIYPFTESALLPLKGLRPRDMLELFRNHLRECSQRGEWVPFLGVTVPEKVDRDTEKQTLSWEQRWNDFTVSYDVPVPTEETELAEIVSWAICQVSEEVPAGLNIESSVDGSLVSTEVHFSDNTHEKRYLAICEKRAQGGGLGKQLAEVTKKCGEIPTILVRTTPFPVNPKSEVAKQIVNLILPKGKGRKVVIEDADLRKMAAMKQFHGKHHKEGGFDDWRKSNQPLRQLAAINNLLDLEKLLTRRTEPVSPMTEPTPPLEIDKPKVEPVIPERIEPPIARSTLRLGNGRSAMATPIHLDPNELRQHMAFLGGPGSGKTTAALNLIEQLLHQGIPAILVDRKGDLCRYADPAAWRSTNNPERDSLRTKLGDRVHVVIYTPGTTEDQGRPLALPIVPNGLQQLSTAERQQFSSYAAAALGSMMQFTKAAQGPKLAILGKAIELLANSPRAEITISMLHKLIEDRDDTLLVEVNGYDDRHFRNLAEDLLTLNLTRKYLFETGPRLDMDELLGRGPHESSGKTRLTVINIQFLGDPNIADFWVSQLLLAVGRWIAKNPSDPLQAVLLFDEADQYLPATRQPASKAPMEHLLRRARSGGVGIFLATQSPGDFDYKCRDQVKTWLIGRVTQPTAIKKLQPLFASGKSDPTAKLSGQRTGEFYLARESEVLSVTSDPSLISTAQLPEERILELANPLRGVNPRLVK